MDAEFVTTDPAADAKADLLAVIRKHKGPLCAAFGALAACEANHYRATLRPGTVAEILGHLDCALALMGDVQEGRA